MSVENNSASEVVPVEPKKKSSWKLILIIGIPILLVVSAGLFFLFGFDFLGEGERVSVGGSSVDAAAIISDLDCSQDAIIVNIEVSSGFLDGVEFKVLSSGKEEVFPKSRQISNVGPQVFRIPMSLADISSANVELSTNGIDGKMVLDNKNC